MISSKRFICLCLCIAMFHHKISGKMILNPIRLPSAIDNSKLKYFPPIINQKGGSCTQASGIGYMFTYEINRLLDRDAHESQNNRFSYLFSWNMLNEGQDQGDFVEQGLYIAKHYGIMTEQDYGTTSGTYQFKWASGYDKYLQAIKYRVKEVHTFPDSIPLMKRWLYDAGNGSSHGGILTFSTMSRGWIFDNNYNGPSVTGYKSILKALATQGAHALTIVGYDDNVCYADEKGTSHKGAFIVANSWGTAMHDNGKFYLPYDFFKNKERPQQLLSNTVEAISVCIHNPKVVFKVGLDFSSRDDISFAMGTGNDTLNNGDINYHPCKIFRNNGGDYPMQGKYMPENIEIAVDISDLITEDNPNEQDFYLNIIRGFRGRIKGKGRITALSLMDYRNKESKEYVYKGTLPMELKDGNNVFHISSRQKHTSKSPYSYLKTEEQTTEKTFYIRTADGKKAKIEFLDSDKRQQKINIRYHIKEEK